MCVQAQACARIAILYTCIILVRVYHYHSRIIIIIIYEDKKKVIHGYHYHQCEAWTHIDRLLCCCVYNFFSVVMPLWYMRYIQLFFQLWDTCLHCIICSICIVRIMNWSIDSAKLSYVLDINDMKLLCFLIETKAKHRAKFSVQIWLFHLQKHSFWPSNLMCIHLRKMIRPNSFYIIWAVVCFDRHRYTYHTLTHTLYIRRYIYMNIIEQSNKSKCYVIAIIVVIALLWPICDNVILQFMYIFVKNNNNHN